MGLKRVLPLLAAGAAIAALVFLAWRTQSVDNATHLQRLANLRKVDALDVALNRAVTQVGVSSMASIADERAATTRQLGDTLDALDRGTLRLRGLSPDVDRALDRFLDTIESKFELAFDFEARNIQIHQRLIQGLDAVPALADTVQAASPPDVADAVSRQLGRLQSEVTAHAVVQTPTNGPTIVALLDELTALSSQSEPMAQQMRRLRARGVEVMADKAELVSRMADFLNRPTAAQLLTLERSYTAWHSQQVAVANQYRLWLAAYAAILLLGLMWLGIRLRRSYRDLDRANAELSHANEHLEEQVEARTHDLRKALDELRASQAQLIQSEKMASLGQMVAGVAHEINTPLGYARSNAQIVRDALGELRGLCAAHDRALAALTGEASDAEVAEAVATARQLAQTVAADELGAELDNLLADTDHGLEQIAELVASLKDFSRVDRSRTDLFDVNAGIDAALKIAQNQLKHRIEVKRAYSPLPQIECSPSQLNQVFLNLITNAAQAIEGPGRIFVHTAAGADGVVIRILDTGSGIPEDVRARIFEPFFTTKPVGQGTGLGLSIVYRIIEDHGGGIEVRSVPGKGSEFCIRLPLRQARPTTPPNPAQAAA